MTFLLVLKLLDLSKVCEATCDSFNKGIWGVLSQEGHHIACFNEKLNDAI